MRKILLATALLSLAWSAVAQNPPGVVVVSAAVMHGRSTGIARADDSIDVRPRVPKSCWRCVPTRNYHR